MSHVTLARGAWAISAAYTQLCTEKFSAQKRTAAGRIVTEQLPPDRRPSLKQFRYYAKKNFGISETKKAQDGIEAYEQNLRPILGNSSKDAMGPGSVFQIDATETDTHLVNSILRERPIGRATHYFTTDAFAGLIAGLYVGLESASMLTARQTLANASMDKVAYCARYGIPIEEAEWPAHHFPHSIVADRGELIAKAADALVEELKLKITNLPARRPDWKPFVEGNFNLANHVLHRLPGAIRRRSSDSNKADPRLKAELDIFGNTQILIEFALYYNKAHILERHPFDLFEIQENVKPRPLDLWNWGILHRSGTLRVKSEDAIRLLLLERGEATVTGFGLRFLEADYDCKTAHDREWFQKARASGRWRVQICYDRRNLDYIYLLPKNRGPLIACPILRRDDQMIGLSLEEIADYQQFLLYRDALMREEEASSKVNFYARTGAVVEEQHELTRHRKKVAPLLSKAEAKRGIRDNRAEERARQNATVHIDIHGQKILGDARYQFASTGLTDQHATATSEGTTSLAKYREQQGLKLLRKRREGSKDSE